MSQQPSLQTVQASSITSLHVYNNNQDIHIGDTHTALTNTPSTPGPLTAGLFTVLPGCSATTTFPFAEYKYVIEGSFLLTDGATGRKVRVEKGGVFYIPKGATM